MIVFFLSKCYFFDILFIGLLKLSHVDGFCMYVSKLSNQHRTYKPFSVTFGFRSVCLFVDPGKLWVSNFDAVIDFSYLTTLCESYITFQPIPQMHGPVQVTYFDNFPGKHVCSDLSFRNTSYAAITLRNSVGR